jgi:hypothetical protein
MTLGDLRKVTVKKNLRIRFLLPNGMECIVNEHGLAQIPALRSVPDFNLEHEFAHVDSFAIEPVAVAKTRSPKAHPERLSRTQLEALAAPAAADSSHGEHEE